MIKIKVICGGRVIYDEATGRYKSSGAYSDALMMKHVVKMLLIDAIITLRHGKIKSMQTDPLRFNIEQQLIEFN